MKPLSMIAALFAAFGLLILSYQFMAYNRDKHNYDQDIPTTTYSASSMYLYRVLALILLLFSVVIIYVFGD